LDSIVADLLKNGGRLDRMPERLLYLSLLRA